MAEQPQAATMQHQSLEAWDVAAVSDWINSDMGLAEVADAVTQHGVDGATAAEMLREDWKEVGASGLESAKLTAAVKKLLSTGAPALRSAYQVISETKEELKMTLNGEEFVVDKTSWLAFRVLEDGNVEQAGTWDPARRQRAGRIRQRRSEGATAEKA